MPQSRARPNPLQALVGGFVGGVGKGIGMAPQMQQRRLEQEKKGLDDELTNLVKAAGNLAELFGKEHPLYLQNQVEQYKLRTGVDLVGGQQPIIVPGMTGLQRDLARAKVGQDISRFETLSPLKRISPAQTESRVEIAGERAKAAAAVGKKRVEEEQKSLIKRAQELFRQRRAYLSESPIMTALGVTKAVWREETEGTEIKSLLSELKGKYGFEFRPSLLKALKLSSEADVPLQGPTTTGATLDTLKTDPLGLFKQ